jgi:hypothetical protein
MASDPVTPSVEQRCIIKFLVKAKVAPNNVLRRLIARYGEETLSPASVTRNKVSEGREQVANRPQAHLQQAAVMNIRRIHELILENRQISHCVILQ